MGKRVILVSTNWEEVSLCSSSLDRKLEVKCTDESHYPLGIAYLHSFLESKGHDVESLWLNNYPFEYGLSSITATIDKFNPDVVGLQLFTPNRMSSYQVIEFIHNKYPNITIVIGGIHTTIMYDQLLRKYPYVIAVLGEGEFSFNNLLQELSTPDPDLKTVNGIAFFHGGNVLRNPDQELIENLDILPFPKHELFFSGTRVNACIITSRGCPNRCSFCCLNTHNKRKVRLRSVENVVDEIEWLITSFPQLKSIWIHDDTFFLNTSRVIQFCDLIISKNIKINFICSGKFKPISKEMVQKLEQAHFIKVLLGLESADESILKRCHKGITQKDVIHAVDLFAKSKIDIYAFIIVGLPGETQETVINTGRFIQKLQRMKYMYYDNIGVLTIYPGTEVYEIAKSNGVLDDDYWLTDKITPLYTVEHSQEQLFLFKEMMLDYISSDRLFTKERFFKQWFMIPSVFSYKLRYLWLERLKYIIHKIFAGKIHTSTTGTRQ
ncbi:B12-binding domain-containing radical SAM protein [uncultured Methanoregula sp.]|uniref:B12-binding domain-containing radical SAM protein n=1 Tax=uncultured Methanoregula sp. TaxID=1005933 RepID=UPI002AAAE601|nr:radical SAM protein [uncultured Methanoregula sp.]